MKPDMLSADDLERLRNSAKEATRFAREAFGARPLTAEEIEAERRSDEWWTKRIAELREQEKQKP